MSKGEKCQYPPILCGYRPLYGYGVCVEEGGLSDWREFACALGFRSWRVFLQSYTHFESMLFCTDKSHRYYIVVSIVSYHFSPNVYLTVECTMHVLYYTNKPQSIQKPYMISTILACVAYMCTV